MFCYRYTISLKLDGFQKFVEIKYKGKKQTFKVKNNVLDSLPHQKSFNDSKKKTKNFHCVFHVTTQSIYLLSAVTV